MLQQWLLRHELRPRRHPRLAQKPRLLIHILPRLLRRPSWHIVAHNDIVKDSRLEDLFEKLNQGIKYFEGHQGEAVQYISTELDYSAEDAREWLGTVRFAGDVKGVSEGVVGETVKVLEKAGVLGKVKMGDMIGVKRA